MDLKKPRTDDSGQIVESGEMVVFTAGERPIFGTQILYFLDPIFGRRAMIEAPVTGSMRREPKLFQAAV
jgi:type IV secretion system protein VirD4